MSAYRINPQQYGQIFALPTSVVDRYLSSASGIYIKVLLFLYRSAGTELDDEKKLAEQLSLPRDDVHEALEFWCKEGLLLPSANGNDPAGPSPVKSKAPEDAAVRVLSDRAPFLSSGEIAERLGADQRLRFVFKEAERLFGRPLTSTEQRSIVSMRDWMDLPPDVILMIFEFCKAIDKLNVRYAEKVASNWCDLGITTHEAAEDYIARMLAFNDQQKAVRECCGISGRNLTSNEKKYIEVWFGEYGFSIDMIRLAFEKTADNTGKISFSYMNKILKQWHEDGILTPEDAAKEKPSKKKKNTASYDLDALDRIGLEIPEL